MTKPARLLYAASARQKQAVQTRCDALWRQWRMRWGLSDGGAALTVTDSAGSRSFIKALDAGNQVWHGWTLEKAETVTKAGALARLRKALFGGDGAATAPIAAAVADEAWNDWWRMLAELVDAVPCSPEQGEKTCDAEPVFSGSLTLRLPWWSDHLCIRLAHAGVLALQPDTATPAPPPAMATDRVPLTQALAEQPVRLRVELNAVSLTLEQLQALAPADVITLQHSLDAPLQVRLPDGQMLCTAWLGQHDKHLAMELIADETSMPHP